MNAWEWNCCPIAFSPALYESSSCYIFSLVLGIINLTLFYLKFSHFNESFVISHCDFNLHYLNCDVKHIFIDLFAIHIYIYFSEVTFQNFYLSLKPVLFLTGLRLKVIYIFWALVFCQNCDCSFHSLSESMSFKYWWNPIISFFSCHI